MLDQFKSKRFDELIAEVKKEANKKNDFLKKKLNFDDSISSNEDDESVDIKTEFNEFRKDRSNSDVLDYWSYNKSQFPILSSLASIILAAPATSVPSERFFSHAGYQLWDRRNRLSKLRFEKMMFIYENENGLE